MPYPENWRLRVPACPECANAASLGNANNMQSNFGVFHIGPLSSAFPSAAFRSCCSHRLAYRPKPNTRTRTFCRGVAAVVCSLQQLQCNRNHYETHSRITASQDGTLHVVRVRFRARLQPHGRSRAPFCACNNPPCGAGQPLTNDPCGDKRRELAGDI